MSRDGGKTAAGNRAPKTPENSAPREVFSLLPAGFVLYLGQKRESKDEGRDADREQRTVNSE